MQILGLSGSLRREVVQLGASGWLRQACCHPAPSSSSTGDSKALPPFCEDDEAAPGDDVAAFREAISAADALLIATPEYNSSIPGVLKNALDWASRPTSAAALRGKPAAVIGASTSTFGAIWAQAETRRALSAAGAQAARPGARRR